MRFDYVVFLVKVKHRNSIKYTNYLKKNKKSLHIIDNYQNIQHFIKYMFDKI